MRKVTPVPLMTTPTVSVVIPCYNYGHFLPFAVESVVSQEDVDVDVLIIDDCSTDDSLQVAEGLAARFPRVRVIRNEKNLGLIGTANAGLAMVTGTYALLISADDGLAPGALARAAAVMEAHPDVGLTYGPVVYATGPDLPDDIPEPASHWVIWDGIEWAERLFRNGANQIYSPEAIVRTSTMREVGDYDPAVPYTSDLQMWLRFAAQTNVGFIAGTVQAYYRVHGANMSMTQGGMVGDRRELGELRHRMAAFVSASKKFPRGARYLRDASRSVARYALLLARIERDASRNPDYVDELVTFAATLDPASRRRAAWAASRTRRAMARTLARTGVRRLLVAPRVRETGRSRASNDDTGVF
ncbi:glycosyltransferase family 2 protein [Microbacterium sulfonylureivorans]|uniref:glycosyltransferase family 2 protein n=1 Tax=Microbacterium sulfonylureivorans TaxID=2486854 RepID=UPI0013E09D83|nr:glycosyltransferase family A protein [Microbacterium sulfonylureivorans]